MRRRAPGGTTRLSRRTSYLAFPAQRCGSVPGRCYFYSVSAAVVFIQTGARAFNAAGTARVLRPVGALDEVRTNRALGEFTRVDMPTTVYAMYVRSVLARPIAFLERLALALGQFLFSLHALFPEVQADAGRASMWRTRLRPASFAAYSAWSARPTRPSASR